MREDETDETDETKKKKQKNKSASERPLLMMSSMCVNAAISAAFNLMC